MSDIQEHKAATAGKAAALPVEAAMPPAPPGEMPPEAVAKIKAVQDALTEYGNEVDAETLARHIRAIAGVRIEVAEVAALKRQLLDLPPSAPGPDRPPPQAAQRRTAGEEN
jgi:hypothetical protein